jgi:hypothetical protein
MVATRFALAPTVVDTCAAIAGASTAEVVVATMGHQLAVADIADTATTWHDFAVPLAIARSAVGGAATTCGPTTAAGLVGLLPLRMPWVRASPLPWPRC